MEVFLTVLLHIAAMEISNQNGIIPARTSQKITATAYPSRRVSYKFKLFYELLSICGMLKFFFHWPTQNYIVDLAGTPLHFLF